MTYTPAKTNVAAPNPEYVDYINLKEGQIEYVQNALNHYKSVEGEVPTKYTSEPCQGIGQASLEDWSKAQLQKQAVSTGNPNTQTAGDYQGQQSAPHDCPYCGRCPHCGRGGYQPYIPYVPVPYNPPTPWYISPTTTITRTSDQF